jgi:phosphocarrier protein HPr
LAFSVSLPHLLTVVSKRLYLARDSNCVLAVKQPGGRAFRFLGNQLPSFLFPLSLVLPMLKGKVVIGGVVGLHARPASGFVRVAERYSSEIRLVKDGMRVNGKSILAILTLAASKGSVVGLEVYGQDEREAFELLKNKLETLDQDET